MPTSMTTTATIKAIHFARMDMGLISFLEWTQQKGTGSLMVFMIANCRGKRFNLSDTKYGISDKSDLLDHSVN